MVQSNTAVNNTSSRSIDELISLSQNVSAETLMLQVQLSVAEDFDEQMRDIGNKIKFLNRVKKAYRENINKIQRFMAQNPNSGRKDGKKYYEASFGEVAELMGAFVHINYDMTSQEMKNEGMLINDTGNEHDADNGYVNSENGHSSTLDWQDFFATGGQIKDPEEAKEYANLVYGDDTDLPFYFGHTNNFDEDGNPKFAVFADPLDKMLEQVKNYMSDVEEQAEELSVRLNQLTAQRKASLDGANQLMRKMEEIKTNTISKI